MEKHLLDRISTLASVLETAYSTLCKGHHLTRPEWRMLAVLAEGEMTGKCVGARLTMHKTKLSRTTSALINRKLIARRLNEGDLRTAFLRLTPEGRAAHDKCAKVMVNFARRLNEAIAPEDREPFERCLISLAQQGGNFSKPLYEAALYSERLLSENALR